MKKITFCINTSRNEKAFVALLLQSLLNGTNTDLHDYLIFVDSDNEGSFEFLLEQKKVFPNLTIVRNTGEPIGYSSNINWMFNYSKTDICSFIQSDMVCALGYDEAVLEALNDNAVVSSVRVEPPLHSQSDNEITYVRNFGFVPDEFLYEEFLEFAERNKKDKLTNYFFAPFTCYKKVWNSISGHDVKYKKSREDSDIALRLLLNGTELKQSWKAMVYHFSCISSRCPGWWKAENQAKDVIRKANDQIELDRFVAKWGSFIHPRTFQDVAGFDRRHIICNNPLIDESKFVIV